MFDNAYEALVDSSDDSRWAFGSGFDEQPAGVDCPVPEGVDGGELATYCLMLGDDALIYAQRLTEWVARAPELEDEVALANIALDLLGQARYLLARAGYVDGTGRGEDALAYFRDEHEFRNVRLCELPLGDFARTITSLLVFSTWRLAIFERLAHSQDAGLSAIAAKTINELSYHRDYAARWAIRLGDGTDYSGHRMRAALQATWPMLEELFTSHELEQRARESGLGVDPAEVRAEFDAVLSQVLEAATLKRPNTAPCSGVSGREGRDGVHTEHMGFLLAEMQSLPRAHPEATW